MANEEQNTSRKTLASLLTFRNLVEGELNNARRHHATPQHSAHEGYAVLLEEVRELESEVFRKKRSDLLMLSELVQVAAMARRMAEDLNLCAKEAA